MDLYSFVRIVTERAGLTISQADRERLVGTLRVSGFTETLVSEADKAQALAIITAKLQRAAATLRVAAAPKQGAELFKTIQQLNSEQLCGKCKGKTESVKLANNEAVNFCTTCRCTLWKS